MQSILYPCCPTMERLPTNRHYTEILHVLDMKSYFHSKGEKHLRYRRMISLLIICLMGIGFVLTVEWYKGKEVQAVSFPYEDRIMGIYIVPDDGVLEGREKRTALDNPGILYEKVMMPYDSSTGTLYLSQSIHSEVFSGEISLGEPVGSMLKGDFHLCAPQDSGWFQKNNAIKEGHLFTLWLVGEDCYYEFQLAVSGLPVIQISTGYSVEPEKVTYEEDPDRYIYDSETLYYGTIDVFDPGREKEEYQITQANVRYHEKGNSSKVFEKKGYSFSLLDMNGDNVDASLLGMRSDNSWKLNALYTDQNRIREKTASQIWEQMDLTYEAVNEAGPRMEYVEVIMDDDYRGLYCLVEPVDEKKLKLQSGDALYKVINWEVPEIRQIQESVKKGWKVQGSVRIRYPKEITDYEKAWYPMKDYLEIFYYSGKLDYEKAVSRVDIGNLSDYLIFTMVCTASDNTYKNMYFASIGDEEGGYRILQIPWDLDYTFGNGYDVEENTEFCDDITALYAETALPRIKMENVETIGAVFWERWQNYRTSILDTDTINKMLSDNRDILVRTGAAVREAARWPESGVDMDIDYLIDFQTRRMEWLDGFFEDWSKGIQ